MDKADEERLIHTAGSQLQTEAACRNAPSINNQEPNPHFQEKRTVLCHCKSSSALLFTFTSTPECHPTACSSFPPILSGALRHFSPWLMSTVEAMLSLWQFKYKSRPCDSFPVNHLPDTSNREVSSAEIHRSCLPHTETGSGEQKPDNNLFGLWMDRSDYKENNNPNSLGWAGDIYSRPAATYIPQLYNTAGSEGGERGGGKLVREKRQRTERLQGMEGERERESVWVCLQGGGIPNACVWLTHRQRVHYVRLCFVMCLCVYVLVLDSSR